MDYILDGKGGIMLPIAKIITGSNIKFIYEQKDITGMSNMLNANNIAFTLEALDVPNIDFGDIKVYTDNEVVLALRLISQQEQVDTLAETILTILGV